MSVEKNCQNESNSCCSKKTGSGYIILIVLYILLAIILGSCVW